MLFRTHLAFSLLIGLYLIEYLNIKNQVLFVIVLLFFSIFPDIDEYSSKISRKLKPISFLIKLVSRHRGILHSVYVPFILSLMLFLINQGIIALAVVIGYCSHLLLDGLTKKGIRPLYPVMNKRLSGFVRVGSILENVLFVFIIILLSYKLFVVLN